MALILSLLLWVLCLCHLLVRQRFSFRLLYVLAGKLALLARVFVVIFLSRLAFIVTVKPLLGLSLDAYWRNLTNKIKWVVCLPLCLLLSPHFFFFFFFSNHLPSPCSSARNGSLFQFSENWIRGDGGEFLLRTRDIPTDVWLEVTNSGGEWVRTLRVTFGSL